MTTTRTKTTAPPAGSRIFGAAFIVMSLALLVDHYLTQFNFASYEYLGIDLYISLDFWEMMAPVLPVIALLVAGFGLLFETSWSSFPLAAFVALMISQLVFGLVTQTGFILGLIPAILLTVCLLIALYLIYTVWLISIRQRRRQVVTGVVLGVGLAALLFYAFG